VKKVKLEAEKKDLEALAVEKEKALNAKLGTIGNLVHDTVPMSNNEVNTCSSLLCNCTSI
jgi:seryl-tRNA synthetase